MKNRNAKLKLIFYIAAIAFVAGVTADISAAQSCNRAWPARLYVVVRDEKGEIADPLPFIKASSIINGELARALKPEDVRPISLADAADKAAQVSAIEFNGDDCNKGRVGHLILRRSDKTMRLMINTMAGGGKYVIELMPFQQGTFKLASGKWEKVSADMYRLSAVKWEKVGDEAAAAKHAQEAEGLIKQLKWAEAEAALRKAVENDPAKLAYLADLGWVLSNQGKHAESETVFKQAAKLEPETAFCYTHLGLALQKQKKWTEAEAAHNQARKLAPKDPMAMNGLAWMWIEQGVKLDEAIALLKQAVSLEPKSATIIDSLGWAYFKKGDTKEAARLIAQAAKLTPDEPEIIEHLADVYVAQNKKAEARKAYTKARSLAKDPEVAARIEAKLKSL